jgi:cytoskeletal protein RodZ
MTTLQKKQLPREGALCIRIQALRKASRFTLEELARATHVPHRHLRALEACEYDHLPEGMYRRAIVQKVLQALGADPEEYSADTSLIVQSTSKQWKEKETGHTSSGFSSRSAVATACALIVVGYLGFQLYSLIRPPSLTITSPESGTTVTQPRVTITGTTDTVATLQINGITVLTGSRGDFRQEIPLRTGMNALVIQAKKKFGGSTTEHLTVFLPQVESVPSDTTPTTVTSTPLVLAPAR